MTLKLGCGKTNYELMRDRMQLKFLEYDQTHMIEKFCLKHDEEYLYIKFVGRIYRINRKSGKAEWSEDGFKNCTVAGYNEAMSIFDILCYSKDGCHLSGKFCNIHQLKGTVQSSRTGGTIFYHQIRYFDGKTEKLCQACEVLEGEKETIGDVSYRLYPFEFLPMMLQFWNSDEEFPANLKIMWDENILDYVHFETAQFIASHVLRRIEEIMDIF